MDKMFNIALILTLVWTCSIVAQETDKEGCSENLGDVFIMIDSSGSVQANNFQKELAFVTSLIQALDIAPDKYRVGVATFDSLVNPQINLNQYFNKQALIQAVQNIRYTQGYTRTDLALQYLRQGAFTEMTGGRNNATNIGIVITDGQSSNKSATVSQAFRARNEGMVLLAIGVGDTIDRAELEAIATSQSYVFTVNTFDALKSATALVANRTCKVNTTPVPITTVPPITECTSNRADVVFALDTSASVGPTNFQKLLQFVVGVVKSFNISPSKTRVAALTFGLNVKKEFHLNAHITKSQVTDAVSRVQYVRGQRTNTGAALKFMREHSFNPNNGDRADVPNIGVVITDGQSQDEVFTELQANLTKANDITLFVIGIGESTDETELKVISSDPDAEHVFSVESFDGLAVIRKKVAQKTCRVKEATGCEYNGKLYKPGERWSGTECGVTCYCMSAALNASICSNRCHRYHEPLPDGCRLATSAADPCCPRPVCNWYDKCWYNGKTYAKNEEWQDGCDYSCKCADVSTGRVQCKTLCPSYASFSSDCTLYDPPKGECCKKLVCPDNRPSTVKTSPLTTLPIVVPTLPTTTLPPVTVMKIDEPSCTDTQSSCNQYGRYACRGSYKPWAKQNCARYCGFCPTYEGNAKGSRCEFPFIFQGQNRTTCIVDGHTQPWCSVTSNYDKDVLWGNCHSSMMRTFCENRMLNCPGYGRSACMVTYLEWGRKNCARYCGYCEIPFTRVNPATQPKPPLVSTALPSGCIVDGVLLTAIPQRTGCRVCYCLNGQAKCNSLCVDDAEWKPFLRQGACALKPPSLGRCCSEPTCPPGVTVSGYPKHYISA